MTTALIVWAEEIKTISIWRSRILRHVRQAVGRCENCDATEKLTIHHVTGNWFAPIVVLCKPCHNLLHWIEQMGEERLAKKTTRYHCPKCNSINRVQIQSCPEQVDKYEEILANPPQRPKGWRGIFWDYMLEDMRWRMDCAHNKWDTKLVCPVCNHRTTINRGIEED